MWSPVSQALPVASRCPPPNARPGLRVLAVNILARFLSGKDNNIRCDENQAGLTLSLLTQGFPPPLTADTSLCKP